MAGNNYSGCGGVTSCAWSFPNSVTLGNTLLVIANVNANEAMTITATGSGCGSTTWTSLGTQANGTGLSIGGWIGTASGTGSCETFTAATSAGNFFVAVGELSANTVQDAYAAAYTSAAVTTLNLTAGNATTAANDLGVVEWSAAASSTPAASGWTSVFNQTYGGVFDQASIASGTTVAFNGTGFPSGGPNAALMVILKYNPPSNPKWNGTNIEYGAGSIMAWNGLSINPISTLLTAWNKYAWPLTATPVTILINGSGGTSGVTPAATDLCNSTIGDSGETSCSTSGVGSGMTYTAMTGNLPGPVVPIGSSNGYLSNGPLGFLCTAGVSVHCGVMSVQVGNPTNIMSLGFWLTPTCTGATTDCAANGGIYFGLDYVTPHFNPGLGGVNPCTNTYAQGIMLETKGGNSLFCLPYVSGTQYRINLLANDGEPPFTATFTGSSASISGTNTLAANQSVQLSTSGTLPSGYALGAFTTTATVNSGNTITVSSASGIQVGQGVGGVGIAGGAQVTNVSGTTITLSLNNTTIGAGVTVGFSGTTYYVLSTGLSGSGFELSLTQGGTAIVAGSAGTGTQTVTVVDQATICTSAGVLGNITATAYTTPVQPGTVVIGASGEEPSSSGPNYVYAGYVADTAGKFSSTSCIL
jgi:hypothetical protein